MLPEYPTSFLLARNIELEYAGMDNQAVWYAMSEYSRKTESSGEGLLFFGAKKTKTKSGFSSSLGIFKTATGMKIKIPGAQILGYYTVKLSRFPSSQS